ncbi:MAG: Rqc2 family fibronectin-binding protein [Catonella sp.]|uniref:Rqc2 family fibronectin-binding protein n=1 Tax=Catonella sp. TaxID=2382125 RepID=UPI003FA0FD17
MSFDGCVVAGITYELKNCLTGGYITKIAQPEKDALVLTVKNNRTQYKLFLSANASLPLAYITSENRKSPMTAPNFCMLLRKHLGNAKILEVYQPEFERIIRLKTEHLDEMGDLSVKHLVIELMGKYSNIILLDNEERVIDSIKHISMLVSSVREILPGKNYFVPPQEGRINPLKADINYFTNVIAVKPSSIGKSIYTSLTGFSPQLANEICLLSGLDADQSTASLSEADINSLFKNFLIFINYIKSDKFSPIIYYNKNETPKAFSVFNLHIYDNLEHKAFSDISSLLEEFYNSKDKSDRIRQKSTDLRKLITNAISRTSNKLDIFAKQLRDTANRDKYRIYGELITTYGYQAKEGDKVLICTDYYSGKEVSINLDTSIPVMANAKKYFDKYARQKRTYEAVLIQQEEANLELNHLDSIKISLDMAENEDDLAEIRKELENAGYAKKTALSSKKGKAKEAKGIPLHFVSSDGFDIFVGKNNIQNDYLTFKLATNSDWWFHAKKCAGSHVILITNGREVPDRTFEEAGKLAVHYSSVNTSSLPTGDGTKHEVDYVQKKEVKKPNGAKPGFVVYYTNYSLTADSDISGIRQI